MASAIKCDRCGNAGTKLSDFIHVRTHTLYNATRFNETALEHFDLCTKCYDEIFSFNEESEDL